MLIAYGQLPLQFEPNTGQTDPRVRFLARWRGYTIFLTPREAVMVLRGADASRVVRTELVGARAEPEVTGLGEQRVEGVEDELHR